MKKYESFPVLLPSNPGKNWSWMLGGFFWNNMNCPKTIVPLAFPDHLVFESEVSVSIIFLSLSLKKPIS